MTLIHATSRRLLRTLSPGAKRGRLIVLTYHSIPSQPDSLAPSEPDVFTFEQQLKQLAQLGQILSLPDAVSRLRGGTLPERAICLTFDDGYRNNYECAAPVLVKLGIPGTFFVTKGAVLDGIMWNDLITEAVRFAGTKLDTSALPAQAALLVHSTNPFERAKSIIDSVKYLPLAKRWLIANELFATTVGGAPPRLMMVESEVAALAKMGFDVGGHSVTHPILATLPDDEARGEIAESATWIKALTGTSPKSFAYPNGRPGRDYTIEHTRMVADAGFQLAVSTQWSCALPTSSEFEIPRVSILAHNLPGQIVELCKLYLKSYFN
jgi:peptidoglycan/xylan/chitin deacetylase (PgdA/CDA1 family)